MTTAVPYPVKRGITFAGTMALPSTIPLGYFADWEVKAEVRRANSDLVSGFIAELGFAWIDSLNSRAFTLTYLETGGWPLGLAEFDLLFTSPSGQKVRSKTISIDITRGITQ